MTNKKTTNKVTTYQIEVTSNPNYCGVGAGNIQFANGKAKTQRERIANWYRGHKGYKVTEVQEEVTAPDEPEENTEE